MVSIKEMSKRYRSQEDGSIIGFLRINKPDILELLQATYLHTYIPFNEIDSSQHKRIEIALHSFNYSFGEYITIERDGCFMTISQRWKWYNELIEVDYYNA